MFGRYNEKGYEILILDPTVSFAPLGPMGFLIFHGAGHDLPFAGHAMTWRESIFYRGLGLDKCPWWQC